MTDPSTDPIPVVPRPGRRRLVAIVAAALVLAVAVVVALVVTTGGNRAPRAPGTPPPPAADGLGSDAPITVEGSRILRGGQPWWFVGYNSFVWSGDCGDPDERMTAEQLDAWFA